ncbi:MAG TPA: phage major capsid protein [Bradyrhizobium sp.]|nr:phage major capsid protein [Bradyrhizobium sp.]
MSTLKDLRERRGRIVTEMRGLLDTAAAEKRDLLGEEQAKYDELFSVQEQISQQVCREERQQELDRRMAELANSEQTDGKRAAEHSSRRSESPRATPEYRAAFNRFLRGGAGHLATEELRALQAGADVDGGYLVAPEQFVLELIKAVDDLVFVRKLARTFQVPMAGSLGAPTLDSDPADADWTSELQTGSEDSSMSFGKRNLSPHPLAKRIKISNQLLRQALIGPEALVIDRLGYKFAVTQEKAFMTGDGVSKPLGVFTPSTSGISTARDVSTGNSATAISFNGLIEAKFTLKNQYWPNCRWVFNREAIKRITKLVDGQGQFLWTQSVRDGEPDRILGLPMITSEWAPSTFTTGLYVGMLGDFQHYWIADALSMQIQRLNELYAETNQVGFIGRLETDGAPVLEEAFVRVKLA